MYSGVLIMIDNSKCENNKAKKLKYFHELVHELKEIGEDASEDLDLAILCAEESLEALAERAEDFQEAIIVYKKIIDWLEDYGCYYDCNVNSHKCNELFLAIKEISKRMYKLEECAYDEIYEGLNKLIKSHELQEELVVLANEYIKCIHEKKHHYPHTCAYDDFDNFMKDK